MGVSSSVSFPGMLQGDLKWGAFRCADVFALPSHQENFGIAVAEALASGLPVLISRKVNIWREVVDADAGFAENDDTAGATALLRRWIEAPVELRSRMRENAVRCFRANFDAAEAARGLVETLKQCGVNAGGRAG